MTLSDTFIRAIKATKKPHKMTDGGGLFLLVSPLGGKWWRYSVAQNKYDDPMALKNYIGLSTLR